LPTELPAAKLCRDLLDPACRDALEYHLHERRDQRFFRPLIALKQLGLEGAVPIAGNLQLQAANSRSQLSFVASVPVATPIISMLTRLSSKMLGHFRLQDLIHDFLQEHLGSPVAELWLHGGYLRRR